MEQAMVVGEPTGNWLDKLLAVRVQVNTETLLAAGLLVAAVLTRFTDLESRVMSHDESLHTFYSWELEQGRGYRHTPLMHGPLQFHLVALSYFLFGDSDGSARIPAALAGVAAVGLIFVFRQWFGRTGTLLVNLTVTDDSGESANSSRVVSIGVGPPVPPPPSQSGKCSVPAKGRQIHFFRVLSEDQSAKVITGQFLENVDCSDVFYLCGDVRLGGLSAGQKELWMGTICQMDDLGNNTFRFHLVGGKNWISVGEDETYVTPQFDCSPHIYCKSFGY